MRTEYTAVNTTTQRRHVAGAYTSDRSTYRVTMQCVAAQGKDRFAVVTSSKVIQFKRCNWLQANVTRRKCAFLLDWEVAHADIARVQALSTRITLKLHHTVTRANGDTLRTLIINCTSSEGPQLKHALLHPVVACPPHTTPTPTPSTTPTATSSTEGKALSAAQPPPVPPPAAKPAVLVRAGQAKAKRKIADGAEAELAAQLAALSAQPAGASEEQLLLAQLQRMPMDETYMPSWYHPCVCSAGVHEHPAPCPLTQCYLPAAKRCRRSWTAATPRSPRRRRRRR
jgi:hypothetical protein